MHIKGIIDRIEGDFVIVEIDGKTKEYPKLLFPRDVFEGDVVIIDDNNVTIDKVETKSRKEHIKKLMNDVWED